MTASVATLKNLATELRIDSILSTTEAGSGHPTSCMSAAEVVATLFFGEMRFDPKDPQNPDNDRFVLSKGHAAPILTRHGERGLFLRRPPQPDRIDRTRGPPTPRLPLSTSDGLARPGHLRGRRTALNLAGSVRLPDVLALATADGLRLSVEGGCRPLQARHSVLAIDALVPGVTLVEHR